MMSRPSRDEVLMDMAYAISERSTCSRLSVGVILAREGRCLSMGYNGAPAGLEHCSHRCDCADETMLAIAHAPDCASSKHCSQAIHAEVNAIAWAARYGVTTDGSELFTTHMPCLACAQLIINAGVMRVIWSTPYRLTSGVELLESAQVEVHQL